MADRPTFAFGQPNWATIGRWLRLDPAEDGPLWMLNLMKYREVAAYADGRESSVSGREADDAYAPLGPLEAVGGMVAFYGDVLGQPSGEPAWDRVAVVRYPTRAAFFRMQERDDYKERFVHKEAGMEFTIIMGCLPDPATGGSAPPSAGEGDLVLRVRRLAGGRGAGAPPDPQGVVPVARFEVDGVVLGDERSWDEVRVDRVTGGSATVAELARLDAAEQIVCVIEPRLDRLVESVVTAPAGGAA